jgi:hypothetical protein
MEVVVLPTSANQTGKTKKKRKPVDKPVEPIHGSPPWHPLTGDWTAHSH